MTKSVTVTYEEIYRKARKALLDLSDYAHYNETLEDAYGEYKPALDRAEYNRVKADQALRAIRDMTIGK